MDSRQDEVIIDLTKSFTLADHCAISDLIIDLDSDQSFEVSSQNLQYQPRQPQPDNQNTSTIRSKSSKSKRKSFNLGDCPICWDYLGKNPLASTKCGHVYCLKCLEHSLKLEKRCPTCRCPLKGNSAYHRLYLGTKD